MAGLKEFYIVEIGPGLYVEATANIFHRSTTNDIFRAKMFLSEDKADAARRQYGGKVIHYVMHPVGEETEEIYILKQAIRQLRADLAAYEPEDEYADYGD